MSVRSKTLLALAALLFSGLVQGLIFPPLNYYWLHPWALVPGFYVLSQLRGKRAFLGGWLIGMMAHLALFYWIAETVTRFAGVSPVLGLLALVLFAAFEGLYFGFFGWGLGYLRSVSGAAWPFAAAAWFVTCEFFNPQLFPFYQGVAFYRVPELFLVSSVTGIFGVTFQVVLLQLAPGGCRPAVPRHWAAEPSSLDWLRPGGDVYGACDHRDFGLADSTNRSCRGASRIGPNRHRAAKSQRPGATKPRDDRFRAATR